jgi:hypothetical protein
MNINKIYIIAQKNKERLESVEGLKRIGKLIDIADENELNDEDTNKLVDCFEELGVETSFGVGF